MKGATAEANELAELLVELTGELTVREMARRYGGGKTMWSEYRCGARIIPLGRLNGVVRDRVRDARGLSVTLARARRLHEAALLADVAEGPAPDVAEALRRAEEDLGAAARLVRSLVSIIAMLLPGEAAAEGTVETAGAEGSPGVGAVGARADLVPYELLDRAVDRLGVAWAVGHAARQVTEGLLAQQRAALPASGPGPAESELALALARTDGALEHLEWEVAQLLEEATDLRGHGRSPRTGAVDGVVLERTDRPGAGVPARYGPPPRDPVRRLGAAATAFVAAAVLGVAALATTAVVVLAGRGAAGTVGTGATLRPVAAPPSAPVFFAPPGTAPGTSAAPTGATMPTLPALPGGTAPSASAPGTLPAPPPPRPSAPLSAPPSPAPTPSASPTPTASATPPSAGLLRLSNAGSRLCLAVPEGSANPADGTVQTGCGERPEQSWYVIQEAAGPAGPVYSVRNRYSGLCLSVDAARTTNDALVTQYLCGDRQGLFPDQFWALRYNGALRAWQLLNLNSGKCAAARAGAQPGEQVTQQDCRDDPWLSWRV
ncbi:RICIN domain-containing protein [Streptomyces sp. NPDC101132]|uniref:RICIN domain-containing protein n=1 Tax=Streptomyces sp. NPDC101132 TaxID=3366110 RepID=UPI00380A8C18